MRSNPSEWLAAQTVAARLPTSGHDPVTGPETEALAEAEVEKESTSGEDATPADAGQGIRAAAQAELEATSSPMVAELPFALRQIEDARRTAELLPSSLEGAPVAARVYLNTRAVGRQIQAVTREIETNQQTSAELLRQRQTISAIMSAAQNAKKKPTTELDLSEFQIRDSEGNSLSAAALLEEVGLLDQFVKDGKAVATLEGLASAGEDLRQRSDENNQGSEMRMLQLQELKQQRDLLVQLASSELSSNLQTLRHILGNLR